MALPDLRAMRLMILGAGVLLMVGALAGCQEQRADNNPFVGPSGAAIDTPYGPGISGVEPDSGSTRP